MKMETTERQKEILNFLIQDYLIDQEPVASKKIVQNYQCLYSPATVRLEMAELEKNGFLYQPHCSAGRIPTDKGYRYYVDNLVRDNSGFKKRRINRTEKEIINLLKTISDNSSELFLRRLLLSISYLSQSLSLFFWDDGEEKRFNYSGLDVLLGVAEKQELYEIQRVCQWLSKAEVNPGKFWQEVICCSDRSQENEKNNLRIYIGDENPIKEIKNWTLMILDYPFSDHQLWSLGIIGPKEMDYPKVIELMKTIQNTATQV